MTDSRLWQRIKATRKSRDNGSGLSPEVYGTVMRTIAIEVERRAALGVYCDPIEVAEWLYDEAELMEASDGN